MDNLTIKVLNPIEGIFDKDVHTAIERMQKIVNNSIPPGGTVGDFIRADVNVTKNPDGSTYTLDIYYLRKDMYLFNTVQVILDAALNVTKITHVESGN